MEFRLKKCSSSSQNHLLKGLTLSLFLGISGNVSADLISDGLGVYDTATNTTWTQDANLLGTLEASNPNLINQIIAANHGVIDDTPNLYDTVPNSGIYRLSANDFSNSGGLVDWWGAQAFVGYLNSISYDGLNQWALPTTASDGSSSQFSTIYGGGSVPSGLFSNVFPNYYSEFWANSGAVPSVFSAWFYSTKVGMENPTYGSPLDQFNIWAVSSNNVASVPLPTTIWLFGSALAGFIGLNRNKPVRT